MGERIASFLGPPWLVEEPGLPRDEQVLGEFVGFWGNVYVTERGVFVSRSLSSWSWLSHAQIADVSAGLDPSPHNFGGPFWGIWITSISGEEHGVGLFHAKEAGDLIRSLASAAPRSTTFSRGSTARPSRSGLRTSPAARRRWGRRWSRSIARERP
jgi:hypothetical protein